MGDARRLRVDGGDEVDKREAGKLSRSQVMTAELEGARVTMAA